MPKIVKVGETMKKKLEKMLSENIAVKISDDWVLFDDLTAYNEQTQEWKEYKSIEEVEVEKITAINVFEEV